MERKNDELEASLGFVSEKEIPYTGPLPEGLTPEELEHWIAAKGKRRISGAEAAVAVHRRLRDGNIPNPNSTETDADGNAK